MADIVYMISSLALILISAEIFTNGVESLGKRLALSQAVVGSLFAAVGTALPETILPFVAILTYGGSAGSDIGVGAILGAPFMLATLAFFLMGVAVIFGARAGWRKPEFHAEYHTMRRDLLFFIAMYGSAIFIPMLLPDLKVLLACLLVLGYVYYAWMTIRGESGGILHVEELYFSRVARTLRKKGSEDELGAKAETFLIVMQVICALGLIVGGAHLFVASLESLSKVWGVSPLIFALLLAPVATEMPEKFNSVTWILKGKDTLAAGNITGAMVFQSTFPVSLGLIFTDWAISGMALFSAILALLAAAVVMLEISFRKKLSPGTMVAAGLFYIVYAVVIIVRP